MPKSCSTLVLLPVGPGTNLEFLLDTLESIQTFALPDHRILVLDDSGEGIGEKVRAVMPTVDLLVNRPPGADTHRSVSGKFFETIAKGIRYCTEQYDFQVLLRMDADALMINPGADVRAIEILRQHPEYGLIGSYRERCDGQKRDFAPTAKIIEEQMGFHVLPAKRVLAEILSETVKEAEKHGYEKGENIIAPGSMMSPEAARKLSANPRFGHPSFRATRLGDDHLVALTLRSMGFQLGDFATGDLPLGVWLKKLEWSPEELVRKGKAIAHSVRSYGGLDEAGVRAEFRRLRQTDRTPS